MSDLTDANIQEGIAIIGMAGRFPGAENVAAFWENLKNGVESIAFYGDEELRAHGIEESLLQNPNYVKAAAALPGIDLFDAGFFEVTPKDAIVMNPQHRIFLECAWEALENAGYCPDSIQSRTGVYAGESSNFYQYNLFTGGTIADPASQFKMITGNEKDYLASLVSYKLNLKGPVLTVQTACSTSLVAVCLACQGLLQYQCDLALAGGVSIQMLKKSGYFYQEGGITSPDGHCRPFDAKAQGTLSGEGVGVVVLKRLEDALADHDHIWAVIKGFAVNNDGAQKIGFTAPSVDGQAQVIAEALAIANIPPETVNYIETHGTGTALGDPVEIKALSQVYQTSRVKKHSCALGSVKSNIGHLDAAAGIASLMKTVLALKHQLIPPTLHFNTPNPNIDFRNSPFYINTELCQWERQSAPRRAGVSSFGIGGTNAHLVLEEAAAPKRFENSQTHELLIISAKTKPALEKTAANLFEHLHKESKAHLADAAYTLQVGRRSFPYRRAFLVNRMDANDYQERIDGYWEKDGRPALFLFPDASPLSAQILSELYRLNSVFREQCVRCFKLIHSLTGVEVESSIQNTGWLSGDEGGPKMRLIAFTLEYALASLWMEWGIQPQAALGAGVGAYVAACLAGVFSLEDAITITDFQGKSLQSASAATSGQGASKSLGETWEAFWQKTPRKAPRIPLWSDLTGSWLQTSEATNPDYWRRQFIEAIPAHQAMQRFRPDPAYVHLEVGPGQTLISALQNSDHPGAKPPLVPSFRSNPAGSEYPDLLHALGSLWVNGVKVDWLKVNQPRGCFRRPLPAYPFERKRYWPDVNPPIILEPAAQPNRKSDIKDWFYLPSWKRSLTPPVEGKAALRKCWLVFADNSGFGSKLGQKLKGGDQEVVEVFAGEGFSKTGIHSYTINPGRAEDYRALISDLAAFSFIPQKILHCFSITGPMVDRGLDDYDQIQQLGFYSLMYLIQAIDAKSLTGKLKIGALSNFVHQVSGEKMMIPEKATLVGICRVIPQEYDQLACCNIDITLPPENSRQEEQLINQVIQEMQSETSEVVIAYRDGHRWVQSFESIPIQRDSDTPKQLRQNGVYLITGGMGGMGLAFAESLARQVRARLVLISRTGLPPRAEWAGYLSQHPAQDELAVKLRKIQEIDQLSGTEVQIYSADVGDESQMRAVQQKIRERFGELNGIIHAAGVAGGGMLQRKTKAMAEEVFRAKIKGVLILDALFRDQALDFMILCSSQRSIMGGFGNSAYCAANNFLDAYANASWYTNQAGPVITAINWNTWQGVGMAANDARPRYAGDNFNELNDSAGAHADAAQGVEVLNVVLSNSLPQVVISPVDFYQEIRRMNEASEQVRSLDKKEIATPYQTKYERPSLSVEYLAPRNDIEKTLAQICQDCIGIEPVGIHDNLFELGADSVIFLQIVARANQAGIGLTAQQIFAYQTIAELAAQVNDSPSTYAPQELITGVVPLAPIQAWFFEQNFPEPQHFNQAVLLKLKLQSEPALLQKACGHLMAHHDMLRSRFESGPTGWRQYIAPPDPEIPFEAVDLSGLAKEAAEKEFSRRAAQLQADFNLARGPLLRFALFNFGPDPESRLLMIIHHLVVDTVSWRFLIEDLQTAYQQLRLGEAVLLPPKTTSYQYWAQKLVAAAGETDPDEQFQYWDTLPWSSLPALPRDFSPGEFNIASIQTVSVSLSPEATLNLYQKAPLATKMEVEDFLLTALLKVFQEWSGANSLLVDIEGHGREPWTPEIDLSRTVGWFTAIYPLVLKLEGATGIIAELKSVKEQIRKNRLYGKHYGSLRYLSAEGQRLRAFPAAEISFLNLGRMDQAFGPDPLLIPISGPSIGPVSAPDNVRRYLLEISAVMTEGQLHVHWVFNAQFHRRETVEQLAQNYLVILNRLTAACLATMEQAYTPSDFQVDDLSQTELDEILDEYNQE